MKARGIICLLRRGTGGPPVALFLAFLLLAGCQSAAERDADEAVASYFVGDYEHARQLLSPIAKETNENFVLNNARLGSTDLAEYRTDDAESAFLNAYEVINSVGVNNGGRSLGAALIDEKIKVWKGEPFERAMVNYYLGVIYYMRHDYNNARAAFENALFKLKDYGDADKPDKYDEIDSNFTLGYIMLARCWQRLGDETKAKQFFDKVTKLRPDLSAVADEQTNVSSNLLIVADWGQGPLKRTTYNGAIAGFTPTPYEAGPIQIPQVFIDGQIYRTNGTARPAVDLLALAQDKKWEDIDTIRTVKETLGLGLMVAGAAVASQDHFRRRGGGTDTLIGLGLLGAGALLQASSHADVRQWEMLPRTSFLIPLHVPPGTHEITLEFPGGMRQIMRGVIAPEQGDNTYYTRMNSWTPATINFTPPPNAPQ